MFKITELWQNHGISYVHFYKHTQNHQGLSFMCSKSELFPVITWPNLVKSKLYVLNWPCAYIKLRVQKNGGLKHTREKIWEKLVKLIILGFGEILLRKAYLDKVIINTAEHRLGEMWKVRRLKRNSQQKYIMW